MQDFDKILGLTQDDKIKTNINMRDSIPANMKLAGTIRFLATGSKYANLQYQFWVHVSTLSRSIPEVWDAIYEKLKLIGHDVNWLSSSWWQGEYPDRQSLYSFFTVFRKKIWIMLHIFLIIMAPLKNGISLRENTIYIRIPIFNGYK